MGPGLGGVKDTWAVDETHSWASTSVVAPHRANCQPALMAVQSRRKLGRSMRRSGDPGSAQSRESESMKSVRCSAFVLWSALAFPACAFAAAPGDVDPMQRYFLFYNELGTPVYP